MQVLDQDSIQKFEREFYLRVLRPERIVFPFILGLLWLTQAIDGQTAVQMGILFYGLVENILPGKQGPFSSHLKWNEALLIILAILFIPALFFLCRIGWLKSIPTKSALQINFTRRFSLMFKRTPRILFCLAIFFSCWLLGCTPVVSQHPVGLLPDKIDKMDKEKFEGTWQWKLSEIDDDVFFSCNVGNDEKTLYIGAMFWNKRKQEYEARTYRALLTVGGVHRFLNFYTEDVDLKCDQTDSLRAKLSLQSDDAETTTGYYLFGCDFSREGYLKIWPVNSGEFKDAVKNGQLKGRIEKHKIVLTGEESENFLPLVKDQTKTRRFFNYQNPWILRRVAK